MLCWIFQPKSVSARTLGYSEQIQAQHIKAPYFSLYFGIQCLEVFFKDTFGMKITLKLQIANTETHLKLLLPIILSPACKKLAFTSGVKN